MGITPNALALALHVPAPRINNIVRERRAITADTAMRLARFFGMSAEFWMGLQSDFEVALAKESLAADLEFIQPFKRVVAA
jgi:addiction module HigA family antidote